MFDMGRAPIKESLSPKTVGQEKPSPYSYEHKITLNSADLTKLGVNDAKVGDVFHVMAHAHVVDSNQTASENGKNANQVGLQLKQMAMRKKNPNAESMLGAVSKGIDDAKGQ